jgi:KDO2-lipid IV(A) lauroyltransferase
MGGLKLLLVLFVLEKRLFMQQKKKKRKKRKNNVVVDWLIYVLVRGLLCVLFFIGVERSLAIARFLGKQMWKHYGRGRDRAITNLKASFPEKDDKWVEETGRRSFEQIVMLVIDVFFTPRLVNKDTWLQYSKYKNIERVKWMMQEGQGVLLVTAHYGNFEIMGYLISLFGFNLFSIARPLDNKFLNNYLYGIREKVGQKIIDKKGASDHMEEIAGSHASIGFIADQDAGKKGVFVDFFGRKASTYKSIGLLAMQYNMPIAIAVSRRVGDKFFFEIEVSRIIMPEEWADKDRPLDWVTQEYVRETEMLIRKDPSQYWWLHRRWKHRPRAERLAAEKKQQEQGNAQ